MSTSGLSHKQQASSRPHFWAVRKVLWKMVKNCLRNRTRPDEIDTETDICTSLKSEFYFRFHWPPSTICTVVTFWEAGKILFFFGPVNNAQFHRFPITQISRNLNTTTSIGVAMKTFYTEFWKFYCKGSFWQCLILGKPSTPLCGLADRHGRKAVLNMKLKTINMADKADITQ